MLENLAICVKPVASRREALRDLTLPTVWRLQFLRWRFRGQRFVPPHYAKQQVIRDYARKSDARILVETGTCIGDMAWALRKNFELIYSVELDPALHQRAAARLARYPHITLFCGDSGSVLNPILTGLPEAPCVFWLDAHYSGGNTARGDGDTPVLKELRAVLRRRAPSDTVLIDDARLFGCDDYPSLGDIQMLVGESKSGWSVSVQTDIIRIHQ